MSIQLKEETTGRFSPFTSAGGWQKPITSTLCPSSSDSSGNTESCSCCSI